MVTEIVIMLLLCQTLQNDIAYCSDNLRVKITRQSVVLHIALLSVFFFPGQEKTRELISTT